MFLSQCLLGFSCSECNVYTLPIQKSRLRGDFGFSQSGPKGVISEIGVGIRGLDGVEIRGLVKYISIYCRWVEVVFAS
jgi:hypothetical protein